MTAPVFQESTQRVLDRCETIVSQRHEIATQLRSQAAALVGQPRRQLVRLSHFFDRPISPIDLLRHPESAAVASSMLTTETGLTAGPHEVSAARDDSIRKACLSLSFASDRSVVVFVQLLYPILLLIMCGLLAVLYSIWLVPEFELMFDDFGLSLPPATSMVITIADWIRRFGLYGLAILGAGLIYQSVVTFRPNIWRTSSGLMHAKCHRFENTKSTWARWAWHVATLVEAGVDTTDAIQIAGDGSGKPWMKTCCDDWVARLRRGDNPFQGFLQVNGVPIPSVGQALRFTRADDQAATLRDAAINYRDVNRSQTLWWSAWLTPITIGLVAFFVGFAFAALFSPLVQLIEGLA